MTGLHGGGHALDLLDHVHALGYLAEYGVAPALHGRRGVVEEAVVGDVDEELRGGRVRVHGAGHGDGADLVGNSVIGFVLDRGTGGFLLHARLETATLDHEVADHTVEHSAVVVAVTYILLEVGNGFRGLVGEQFQSDDAVVGVQLDHGRCALDFGQSGQGGGAFAPKGHSRSLCGCQGVDGLGIIRALS